MSEYNKLGKNEIPKAKLINSDDEMFLISYNEFNGNFTLYSISGNNTLNKIKSGGTPTDYDAIVFTSTTVTNKNKNNVKQKLI